VEREVPGASGEFDDVDVGVLLPALDDHAPADGVDRHDQLVGIAGRGLFQPVEVGDGPGADDDRVQGRPEGGVGELGSRLGGEHLVGLHDVLDLGRVAAAGQEEVEVLIGPESAADHERPPWASASAAISISGSQFRRWPKAPFRSIRWSTLAPASYHRLATSRGVP